MNTLRNIKAKDREYARILRLLYYALSRDMRKAVEERGQLLTIATDLFFIFYSVMPSLVEEEIPDSIIEGARLAFKKLWETFMQVKDEEKTTLNFRKSFYAALKFLQELASRQFVYATYQALVNANNIEYLLTTYVLSSLKQAEPNVSETPRAEGHGSQVSKGDQSPFEYGMNYYIPRDVINEFVRGFLDAIYSSEGGFGTVRRTSIIVGVAKSSDPTKAKLQELVDEDMYYAKMGSGELLAREYGELELSVVAAVDYSSSTFTSMVTNDIRIITYALHEALEMLRSRHEYIFFKDYPLLVERGKVAEFLRYVKADGGTSIDQAVYLADKVASSMAEDTSLLLISDCEDTVTYVPTHHVASIIITSDVLNIDEMTRRCTAHYASLGPQLLLKKNEILRTPRQIGHFIGSMLVS